MIEISIKSLETGRVKSGKLTLIELFKEWNEDIIDELIECDCQPIGETNVVECNCYQEWEGEVEIKIREENEEWKIIGNWTDLLVK